MLLSTCSMKCSRERWKLMRVPTHDRSIFAFALVDQCLIFVFSLLCHAIWWETHVRVGLPWILPPPGRWFPYRRRSRVKAVQVSFALHSKRVHDCLIVRNVKSLQALALVWYSFIVVWRWPEWVAGSAGRRSD